MNGPTPEPERIHDVVAIGAGPFNLALAALADPVPDLDVVVLEARDQLAWHPGLLLDEATLQVPFLADLASLADPTSRWSYLSFLHDVGRLYPFYIRESFYPLRREYDEYLRWAAERLGCVRFGHAVTGLEHHRDPSGDHYVVTTATGRTVRGRRVVVGVGTEPVVPEPLRELGAVHSADYLRAKALLQAGRSIAVVGSGQSAAEVYFDLLSESPEHDYDLTWLTRSPRFFPMEYTKLTLELTSPEYTGYFQELPAATRASLLREQRSLYKGISGDLVDAISDLHYRLRVSGEGPRTTLVTGTEVVGGRRTDQGWSLELHHAETDEAFRLETEGLVVATGYAARPPAFLDGIRDRLRLDEQGRPLASATYAIDHGGCEVFVQNAEEHTHGFVAPDLGMGAYRASVIINAITGRAVYEVPKRVAVQSFGVPDHLRDPAAARR